MKTMFANGVRGAATLFLFAVVFTALMAGTYQLTRKKVMFNEEKAKVALIAQVLPAKSFDNNLLKDAHALSVADGKALGNDGESAFYLAKKAGKTVAAVFEATAPDGYAGKIKLLVGVDIDGQILGVRVVVHKETPGLGDYIDAAKSPWIEQFKGKELNAQNAAAWKVKKDGGGFDYMVGATISPRAVTAAVKRVLEYVHSKPQLWGTVN
ncbi:electron transport complex subunit RsxG [Iodobacter ciconiae]|uniref:Ion-translocating oxidoreductase complex subunit G n=1 Tax=Iodobacter ciconiae TaxID=2496266 RepID=A0A3S8ZWA1_9NEIS|nr:electron transport complex subunit RsxG [Iodobacter ciconiae]AZN37777.1 electron transport complex subunit RsxG [Iodobacter ciconiae]